MFHMKTELCQRMYKRSKTYHSTLHWAWRGPAQQNSEVPMTNSAPRNQQARCILPQTALAKHSLHLTTPTAPAIERHQQGKQKITG